VDLFISSTCPYCHKADQFFANLVKELPWLRLHRYVINQNRLDLNVFYQRLQKQKSTDFSVPAIFFCNSRWTGFLGGDTSGRLIVDGLRFCHQHLVDEGQLSTATINVLQKWGTASQFQLGADITDTGPFLLPYSALLDAFSPCAFFCLISFIALLCLYFGQIRSQRYLGLVFLASLGVAHAMQQAHAVIYYQVATYIRWPSMVLGVLLLMFIARLYPKIKTNQPMRMGLLVFLLMPLMVWALHINQQTCVLNLAMIIEQWIKEQAYSSWLTVLMHGMYQLFYLLPLIVVWFAFLLLGRWSWLQTYQRLIKLLAVMILAADGLILLLYPAGFVNAWFSVLICILAIVLAFGFEYRFRQEDSL
jgi:hypothetical protein